MKNIEHIKKITPYQDINDVLYFLKKPASPEKIELTKKLHSDVEQEHEKWSKKIECSYIPLDMLQNILPPKIPRPYIGGGTFYSEAPYGNEWLINKYFLYKY